MRITAFKIPRAKRFEYIPRFYDPQKEMRRERERRILRELENEKSSNEDASGYKPMGKGDVKHYFSYSRASGRRISRGNFLLRLITIVLALVVALLVFYGTFVLVKLV